MTVEAMADALSRLQTVGVSPGELHASIAGVLGVAPQDVIDDAVAMACEMVQARLANAEREADRLLMLGRLASATGCPPGMSIFVWLESLGLAERDGDKLVPTAKATLRAV
jgi:hypothetical protein